MICMSTRGIHLVWTTYLNRLPGDDRGHWSPLFGLYGRLHEAGHRLQRPDPVSRRIANIRAKEPAKELDFVEQVTVAAVLARFSTGEGIAAIAPARRGTPPIRALALAVESNHVHMLIRATNWPVDDLVGRMKSKTSSPLLKLPCNAGRSHIWAAGYWKVFLVDGEACNTVRECIEAHNTRRGREPNPWDWVEDAYT